MLYSQCHQKRTMEIEQLISKSYLNVLEKEHQQIDWGLMGVRYTKIIDNFCKEHKLKKIVDYGSGQGLTTKKLLELGYDVIEYEPGIKEKRENFKIINSKNFQSDLLICTDVLEHVEYKFLLNTFKHFTELNIQYYFFSISLRKAIHILNDGRNAHLIVKSRNWWIKVVNYFFIINKISMKLNNVEENFSFFCTKK